MCCLPRVLSRRWCSSASTLRFFGVEYNTHIASHSCFSTKEKVYNLAKEKVHNLAKEKVYNLASAPCSTSPSTNHASHHRTGFEPTRSLLNAARCKEQSGFAAARPPIFQIFSRRGFGVEQGAQLLAAERSREMLRFLKHARAHTLSRT